MVDLGPYLKESETINLSPYIGEQNISLSDYFKDKPKVEKPSLVSRGLGAVKVGLETAGTLAASGAAWTIGLIAGAGKMLPERGIGEDVIDLDDVLEGRFEPDPRSYQERAAEAGRIREEIQSIPTAGLEETPQKIVEKVAWPFERVEVAKQYWAKQAAEKLHPDMGPVVGNAFEVTVFIGLPKLATQLKSNIKSRKKEATRESVREIHRAQLRALINEPNRLEHLARVERNLKETGTVKPAKKETFGKLREDAKLEIAVTERALGDTTFSMLGTQNAYNLLIKNRQFLERLHDTIDVQAKWERMNAPETGLAFKNTMSRRAVMEEATVKEVATNSKLFDQELAPDVVLAAENPKLRTKQINNAVDHLLDFQETIRKEYARRGVKLDFKGRIKNELLELIEASTNPAEIAELRKAIKKIDRVNFVHIPSAFWFENLIGKDPVGGSRILDLVATQKRKNLTIKSLVDQGLVKREDLHPGDIIASYGRRAGKDFALLDLRDAAKKEGLAYHRSNKNAPEGYVDAPKQAYILKEYKLEPAFADALDAMTRFSEGRYTFDRAIALTKMTAFYNPLFLPMYDMVQGTMLGSVVRPSMPKGFYRGMKDSFTRNKNWQEAGRWGLFSKPFNNPLNSYMDMVGWAKKTKKQKFFRLMESVYPKNWLKSAYTPGWTIAWKLDEGIRMMSYNFLRKQGFSQKKAAQTAALFHGDYASVPAATRQKLNRVFFTPTFKIAMGKLYTRMMNDAVKSATKMGRTDKVTNRFAKGALYTASLMIGFDQFMINGLGYKRDEFGRRYVRDVIDKDGNKRQDVFTFSTPFNMWQKYYYRVRSSFKAGVPQSARKLLEYNRWEFHPLWRTAYDVLITNNNGIGDKIYSEFDDDLVKIGKGLKYSFTNIVRIAGVLDQQASTKEAQESFAKEYGTVLELATRPFAFKYIRSDIDKRTGWKLKNLSQRFRSEMNTRLRKEQGFSEVWLKNFLEEVDRILAEREEKKAE